MKSAKYMLVFFMLLSVITYAQKGGSADTSLANLPPTDTGNSPETPKGTQIQIESDSSESANSNLKSLELILCLSLLIFGLVAVVLEVYLATIGIIKSEHIFKCIILTLVITTAALLVLAGLNNNQITGVLGILGSISGYLIGKMDFSKPGDSNDLKHKTDKKDET